MTGFSYICVCEGKREREKRIYEKKDGEDKKMSKKREKKKKLMLSILKTSFSIKVWEAIVEGKEKSR